MKIEEMLANARHYKHELRQRMGAATVASFGVLERGAEETVALTNAPSANWIGVGFGCRENASHSSSANLAVRVYVKQKLPKSALRPDEVIPATINGMDTDVVELGELQAQAEGGDSIGHKNVTAGTLGCLVERTGGTRRLLLSNNHILADCNRASLGDAILAPGRADGGTQTIATLSDFEKLKFDSSLNQIDAAIAELVATASVTGGISSIEEFQTEPMEAALYQSVRKTGRTTRHTLGIVMDVAADVRVRFGFEVAEFEDLISIQGLGGPFSADGDSGSVIFDAVKRRPVALLIGGSSKASFGCRIGPVLDRFQVKVFAP